MLQRCRTFVLCIIKPMLLASLDTRISLKRTLVALLPDSGTKVVQDV